MNSLENYQYTLNKKDKYLFYKIMSESYNWKTLCDYPFIGSHDDLEVLIDEFLDKVQAFFSRKANDDRK